MGFAAATTNPFTVNIAQSIAGLPLNSAMGFRILFFVCCMTVTLVYMLRYGAKVRANPDASYVADVGFEIDDEVEPPALTRAHVAIVVACVAIFLFILWAVQAKGWWLPKMMRSGKRALSSRTLAKDDSKRALSAYTPGSRSCINMSTS